MEGRAMKAADIDKGIDAFFQAQGSSEAQRADAIAVLHSQCAASGDDVVLTATGEILDSDASRAWLQAHKPHLLPPVYERSLADRAFVDGSITARGALVKQIGMDEANKLAERYGLRSVSDTRRGTAPTRDDDANKKDAGRHRNNPFHRSNWNITAQARLLKAVGPAKCAQIAAAVGATIGQTKPNMDY
jgi:hypothetical protein